MGFAIWTVLSKVTSLLAGWLVRESEVRRDNSPQVEKRKGNRARGGKGGSRKGLPCVRVRGV